MKDKYEEPKYLDVNHCEDKCTVDQVKREIRSLCAEEPFAVLATLGEGEPATSLISFVVSNDLKYLAFSTPTKTRKFDQIVANKKVSILIDNRSQQPESINMICGLTISGNARVLKDIMEVELWSSLLIKRHPYLEKFINAETSSMILIEANSYCYVKQFQQVFYWTP